MTDIVFSSWGGEIIETRGNQTAGFARIFQTGRKDKGLDGVERDRCAFAGSGYH